MLETKAKRGRGRPKGAKDKQPRSVSKAAMEAAAEIKRRAEERVAELADHAAMWAGNGRDEAADEPEATATAQPTWPEEPPQPAPSPHLSKLFVAAVENGYVLRPAYSDSYKGAADNRSWVVTSREELARMVSWLMAERGATTPDFLGGPQVMPQPVDPHYAPPIGLQADETAS